MGEPILPEGMREMSDPFALVSHGVEPVLPMDGPIRGPMIALTLRYAPLKDILDSFDGQPPGPEHRVPNEQDIEVLVVMESIPAIIDSLIGAYRLLEAVAPGWTRPSPNE